MGVKEKRRYTPAFKVQLIEESRVEGVVIQDIAKKHGILPSQLSAWRANEKEIRKLLPKANGSSNGHTNGKSNGHSEQLSLLAEVVPKQELKIIGLTPLIRELVNIEIQRVLPALVEARLAETVDLSIKKAFTVAKSN